MSFTVLTALARDNKYGLVILIAGTSVPLFEQSDARIQQDLALATRDDRTWFHISRPQKSHARQLEMALSDWVDAGDSRQTVMLTVMKNHSHLDHLVKLLQALDLTGTTALVIDDEADQASLNTQARSDLQSTTYSQLLAVRSELPSHTLVQYTATPQAPLLISIIDTLSPRFARVLTPGTGYVGGRTFFIDQPGLVREIPSKDLKLAATRSEPPASLSTATRLFLTGVAAEWCLANGHPRQGNRSMMVHPSQRVAPQVTYARWIRAMVNLWAKTLGAGENDEDRIELESLFAMAYEDLSGTVLELPSWDSVKKWLARAIGRTAVTMVNTARGPTPQIEWRNDYSHILVGGQAMDRGYTVQGLTVTYMPRPPGAGNLDTIQQRARFFGYKRSYLGYCRVFLEPDVRDAYKHYVEHEEFLRRQLVENGDQPLSDWRRIFMLDPRYKATRANVLRDEYLHVSYSDRWFRPSAPHRNAEAVAHNRRLVREFVDATGGWNEDVGDERRTEPQRHLVVELQLHKVYSDLLVPWRIADPRDSLIYTGIMLQIEIFLEREPEAIAVVYQMSRGQERVRGLTKNDDQVLNLFQGRNPTHGAAIYPGDEAIRADTDMSIQIHQLRVGSEITVALPIWVPKRMAANWLLDPRR